MKHSYYGIKFVWDKWRGDQERAKRITFNSKNPIYYEYFIPEESQMLIYVLGDVQQLQGMCVVTGPYSNSGNPRFNIKVPIDLVCDKSSGLTIPEIKKHLRMFNPHKEGISYLPIKKSIFDLLYKDLQNKT